MDHPVLGVGRGNWEYRYPLYAGGEHININAAPRRPHNDLLWIVSETGIVGLGFYLALLIASFIAGIAAVRHGSAEDRLMALSLMAVFTAPPSTATPTIPASVNNAATILGSPKKPPRVQALGARSEFLGSGVSGLPAMAKLP